MDQWTHVVLTIIGSVAASTGFWAFMQRRVDCNTATHSMLLGLGHDRIMFLGMLYIERGYITRDEYENLHDYLYVPYKKMGGNGSALRVMEEVGKLPIRKEKIREVRNEPAKT